MFDIVKAGEIINTGIRVVDIMRDSVPTISLSGSRANAIPKYVSWEKLSGWQYKKWRAIKYERQNNFGLVLVRLYIDLTWQCRGNYRGSGDYILNASANVRVDRMLIGGSIDIGVEFGTPYNDRSTNDPLATLPFCISIGSRNLMFFKDISKYDGYLRGDGYGTYGCSTYSESNYPNSTKSSCLDD